jgi:hypothetical protein
MSVYLDCWQNKPIDIFLVTFNTAKSEDRKETFEIIRRVLTHTTTPFNLTIIDNRSDDDFWHQLQEQVRGNTNVRMIRKDQNQFCGPASNIALRVGDARYAIYLCSKEGFVAHHGWERTLINYMDRNLNVAIAGHLCHQPRFVYGAELTAHPDFRNFRNQDFAQHNPNRAFTHIQGGLFILRRDVYAEVGGFNDATPQNNTDVELSYYLESQGKLLGKIPEVVSLTTKTLPPAMAQLTEQTVAAHPFTVDSASQQLDVLCTPNYARCNLCGWNGRQDDFVRSTAEGRDPPVKCPNCSSSGLGRMLYAHLASDRRAHRGSILAALIDDDKLVSTLGERMFRLGPTGTTAQTWLRELGRDCGDGIGLMIVNPDLLTGVDDDEAVFWREALGRLRRDGAVVFADRAFSDKSARHSLSVSSHVAATALNGTADQFQIHYCDQQSRALAFDWCRLGVIERLATVR